MNFKIKTNLIKNRKHVSKQIKIIKLNFENLTEHLLKILEHSILPKQYFHHIEIVHSSQVHKHIQIFLFRKIFDSIEQSSKTILNPLMQTAVIRTTKKNAKFDKF